MQSFLESWSRGFRPYLLLTLFCALLYIPGQVSLPVMDRDEARFAQASKQMLESGNYIVPYFQEDPRTKKPIGIYWLQSAAVAANPFADDGDIWAFRLPSLIAAWASVLLTFAIGAVLFDRATGLAAGALLAGSTILIAEAHLAKTDATLLFTILLSVYGLALADRRAARLDPLPGNWVPTLLFWGGLGLSILIKGPIGPAVVFLTALPLGFVRGDWSWVKVLRPGRGILLLVVLVSPWLIPLTVSGNLGFISESASEDLIPKLLSGQESHGAPPGTYLGAIYLSFWPMSLFVVPALVAAWAWRREPGVAFALTWWLPAWIMFELFPTKLPHYVLPTYPALALLGARLLTEDWAPKFSGWGRWFTKLHIGLFALVSLVFAGASLFAAYTYGGGSALSATWWSLPIALIVCVGAGFAARAAWRGTWAGGLGILVVMLLVFAQWAGFVYAPRLDELWVARETVKHLPPEADRPALASAGYNEPSLVFRAGTETKLMSGEQTAQYLAATPGAYALVSNRRENAFFAELSKLGGKVEEIASFDGFNYSRGNPHRFTIYRSDAAEKPAEKPAPAGEAPPAKETAPVPEIGND